MKQIALLALLLLTACSTPYQKNSPLNPIVGGYSDLALSNDTYLVTMHGGNNTSPEKVFMMLFYRASELTTQKGSQYFIVENIDGTTNVKNIVLPSYSSSQTTSTVSINPYNYSGEINSKTSGYTIPSQSYQVSEPIMRAVIKVLPQSQKPKDGQAVDARFIMENWASKVGA